MAEADPGIPLPSQISDSINSSKPIVKPTSIVSAIASLPSNTDAFLGRLQKCLSTPAGTDVILVLLCYGSKFLAQVLASASITTLHHRARQIVALALSMPGPNAEKASVAAAEVLVAPASATGLAAQLMGVSNRLQAFSGMLTDARAFSRLWGLLGMYFWAKQLILTKRAPDAKAPKAIDAAVAYASLASCIVFQGMENVAYLGTKNVLPVSPKMQGDLYRWSSRLWAFYVALDLGRLLRELVDRRSTRQERRMARAKAMAENMDPSAAKDANKSLAEGNYDDAEESEEKEWLRKWRNNFLRQCSWAPLTLHYSSEKGLLSEAVVGILGSIPGFIQLGDLWKEAGKS